MKTTFTVAVSVLLVNLSIHAALAGETVYSSDALTEASPALTLERGEVQYSLSTSPVVTTGGYHIAAYLDEEGDYKETPIRRFEIIFFISMPVTLGLSFAGLAGYKLASGSWGIYENIDYLYLALSTVSLSFTVALRDNRVIYKKRGT